MSKISPVTTANELFAVQEEIAVLEKRADALKAALLENLQTQGVRRVDMANGKQYIVIEKSTVSMVAGFKDKAEAWAKRHKAMKVDTAKVKEMFEDKLDKLPEGFKVSTTEYLTVRENK